MENLGLLYDRPKIIISDFNLELVRIGSGIIHLFHHKWDLFCVQLLDRQLLLFADSLNFMA